MGAISFDVKDETRAAMYASPPAPRRFLKVMSWYPAAAVEGYRRRPYLDIPEQTNLPSIFPVSGLAEAALAVGGLETASHAGAPAAEGRYPTLVFCHGGMCYPQQNTFLFEDLASHGYIVLSVSHPHESGTHALADGTIVEQSARIAEESGSLQITPEYLAIYFGKEPLDERLRAAAMQVAALRPIWLGRLANDWARDCIFVVDRIAENAVPPSAGILARACDLERLAYFGMSYGGHVAALACLGDPRSKAAINMDGGLFTAEVLGREIGVPVLALTSDAALQAGDFGVEGIAPATPASASSADVMYQRPHDPAPAAPVHRITIPGARHQDFTDFCWLFADMEVRPSMLGPIGAPMIDVQRRLVRRFLDSCLSAGAGDFAPIVQAEFEGVAVMQNRELFLQSDARR